MKVKPQTTKWFNYAEFYDLVAREFKGRKGVVCVELGVWKGHSIGYLAALLPEAELHGFDLFEDSYRYEAIPKLQNQLPTLFETAQRTLNDYGVWNVRLRKAWSWEAASEFEDLSVDFLFIDADHSKEAVTKDIQAWLPKVKIGGIIAGHDYDHPQHPGVREAVDEAVREGLLKDLKTHEGTVWFVRKED